MSALWLAPLILILLALIWAGIQRAWLACMDQPAAADALARSGPCGCDCGPGPCARSPGVVPDAPDDSKGDRSS